MPKHGEAQEIEVPYGATSFRLSWPQWLVVGGITWLIFLALPPLWTRVEPFQPSGDYRIPYALSDDYWQYRRWMREVARQHRVTVIGDSVVWGEYVTPENSLSEFLNEATQSQQFANGGLNGSHPLALEGLIRWYGADLRQQRVLLHCNLLWMSSPERDLSAATGASFNHPRLLPQLARSIPAYTAAADDRLGNAVDHHLSMRALVHHWRVAHLDGMDLASWSRENPYRNPVTIIAGGVAEPSREPRHAEVAWFQRGIEPRRFEWVDAASSLQLDAFQRAARLLRDRGNQLLVVVGPFNEHLLMPDDQGHARLKTRLLQWLDAEQIPHVVPDLLPTDEYGDASHPLAPGYRRMAEQIVKSEPFRQWLAP